jgi:TonB-dependent receptor
MKKFIVLAVCAFFSVNAIAQKSTLKVKVVDDNNLNLPGANILVEGTKIFAITDATGTAYLLNIASGNYSIVVSYIGYTPKTIPVSVAKNTAEVTVQLNAGVVLPNSVLVLGDRLKGQAKALNQQKNSSNISNIVSADQIGRFPDANIGDAVKRVPGITMQNDQGEARDIIIRGLAPQLNAVTINGDRIPSAEGDNRRIQMDLIPSDMVQTVEVSKTLTPDMDGDAIGGSVNLVTRSAPNKLRISGTGSAGLNPIRGTGLANFSLVAGGRIWNKKLGLVASTTLNNNNYGSDNIEAVWQKTNTGKVYIQEHDVRRYDVRRMRRSISLAADLKINKNNTLTFSGIYNWRDDWENRYRNRVTGITPQIDGSGNITGYTGEVRKQTKGGIDSGRINGKRLEEQITQNYAIKGEHIVAGKATIEWSSSFAKASEKRPNERYLEYNRTNLALSMDIADGEFPNVTPTNRLLASNTNFRRITEQNGNVFEKDWNNRFSVKFPVKLFNDKSTVIKVGGRYSVKEKERVNDFYRYVPRGNMTGILQNLRTTTGAHDFSIYNYQPGSKYIIDTFISPVFAGFLNLQDGNNFTKQLRPEEFLALNYRAEEKISAAYLRINQEINDKMSMVIGLRMEQTKVDYTGNIVQNETQFKGEATLNNDYINVLPSINFKYDIKKDLILKAAVTTALARPGYYELVPYRNTLTNDQEITVGNPSLKATTSTNGDLMIEKYFKSVGLFSAGVFYKNLKDFIYTYSTVDYDTLDYQKEFEPAAGTNPIPNGQNWTYRQSRNGNNVNVYGFEVAFQRQLDFLPGAWKGLGVYLNYTYTKSEADGVYNSDGVKRTGLALPGTAPHLFNASLSFENKKFIARISANYTAAYLDEVGAEAFYDRYYDKQFFLDFNASYSITSRLRTFVEINNITNQPLRYYTGQKDRTAQLEYYRSRWNTGLKFDLF